MLRFGLLRVESENKSFAHSRVCAARDCWPTLTRFYQVHGHRVADVRSQASIVLEASCPCVCTYALKARRQSMKRRGGLVIAPVVRAVHGPHRNNCKLQTMCLPSKHVRYARSHATCSSRCRELWCSQVSQVSQGSQIEETVL